MEGTRTIELLEKHGYEGPDAGLAISLFEYDIAWRNEGDTFKFIFRRPNGKFGCSSIRKDVDPQHEWGCVDYAALAATMGTTVAQWLTQPLTQQVQELMLYHGQNNVFGTQSGEGFEIEAPARQ